MTHSTTIIDNYKHIFASDPIIISSTITSADVNSLRNAKVPQLVIVVTANGGHVHEISQQFIPIAGDVLYTDISSALQAEYQLIDRQQEPSPNLTSHSYVPFKASVQAYVRYLENGEEQAWAATSIINSINVLRGGLQPQLRKTMALTPSAAVQAFAANMTTKPHASTTSVLSVANPSQHPSSPALLELKNVGDIQLSSSYSTAAQSETVSTQASAVSAVTAGLQLIAEQNPNRHQLIFRNSMGVLETFSALSLSKDSLSPKSDEFPIISNPSYSPNLNLLTQAQNPSRKIEMSTGFIPSVWAEWFVREVLTATYVWIAVPILNPKTGETTSATIPVHLEADDVTLVDKTKTQLPEVNFKIIIPSIE